MKRSLPTDAQSEIETRLAQAHAAFQRHYPGDSKDRQPVHVVYGGAHLFRSNTTQRLGELALRSLDEFAPDFIALAKAISLSGAENLPASSDAAGGINAIDRK